MRAPCLCSGILWGEKLSQEYLTLPIWVPTQLRRLQDSNSFNHGKYVGYVSIKPLFLALGRSLLYRAYETDSRFSGIKVCVSPIVGGDAVKGPAGKIMTELRKECLAFKLQGSTETFATCV
ncbi:MAG: hypothetical protein CM1200mP22_28320 [Dehalococcoidia bacterium]|nr:MAG: hypothetical protein CM1200mP22_28320 [Dehalococcoidia bacterium]